MKKHLTVKQLQLSFKHKRVLGEISFSVHSHQALLITGKSGRGKSLLADFLAHMPHKHLSYRGIYQQIGRIGYIPQNAHQTLHPTRSVYQQLLDVAPHKNPIAICRAFRFPEEKLQSYSLSQGQASLAAIMLSLATDPDILIADMPFCGLDQNTIDHLVHYFNALPIAKLFLLPHKQLDLQCTQTIHLDDEQIHFTISPNKKGPTSPFLTLENVAITQPKSLFSPISVTLDQGCITGLSGPNGAGKSSLIKAIMQTVPYEGTIYIDKTPINKELLYKNRTLQVLFQDTRQSFNPHFTLNTQIQDVNIDIFSELLAKLPSIDPWENRYPHDVSLTTIKALALIRVLAREPQYLLLDEPFSGLSDEWRRAFLILLQAQNIGMLIVDHDYRHLRSICHECYVLNKGALHAV